MKSVTDKILARLYRKGRTFAFTAVDFTDLGKRAAVDKALSSLVVQEKIRRLSRGLFDYPNYDDRLGGILAPSIHQVAKAIARKNGVNIQASGALAANILGLSTQVPARSIYLTNGKSRLMKVGNRTIQFTRTSPKKMQKGHELSILVANALRWLGKNHINNREINILKRIMDGRQRKRLLKDLRYAEDWIYAIAQKVATEEDQV